jgi:hypothetical protein
MPDHEFDWRKAIAEIKANFGILGTGIEEIATGAARDARREGMEEAAQICENPVNVLALPDASQYEGDERPIERRVALALAAAIRAAKEEPCPGGESC